MLRTYVRPKADETNKKIQAQIDHDYVSLPCVVRSKLKWSLVNVLERFDFEIGKVAIAMHCNLRPPARRASRSGF